MYHILLEIDNTLLLGESDFVYLNGEIILIVLDGVGAITYVT